MEQKYCTKCGAPLKTNAKFCIKCGMPVKNLISTSLTDNASALITNNIRTPSEIDTKLEIENGETLPGVTRSRKNEISKMKMESIIFPGLIVVFMLVIIGFFCFFALKTSGTSLSTSYGTKSNINQVVDVKTTAEELTNSYINNTKLSNKKYQYKNIVVKGNVVGYVTTKGERSGVWIYHSEINGQTYDVYAIFANRAEIPDGLKQDEPIAIKGQIQEYIKDSNLTHHIINIAVSSLYNN